MQKDEAFLEHHGTICLYPCKPCSSLGEWMGRMGMDGDGPYVLFHKDSPSQHDISQLDDMGMFPSGPVETRIGGASV